MLTVCGTGAIFSCFFLSERTQARGKRKESIKGESRARGARQVPIVLIALFLSRETHPSHTFHAHLALTSTMSPFLRHFFTSEQYLSVALSFLHQLTSKTQKLLAVEPLECIAGQVHSEGLHVK